MAAASIPVTSFIPNLSRWEDPGGRISISGMANELLLNSSLSGTAGGSLSSSGTLINNTNISLNGYNFTFSGTGTLAGIPILTVGQTGTLGYVTIGGKLNTSGGIDPPYVQLHPNIPGSEAMTASIYCSDGTDGLPVGDLAFNAGNGVYHDLLTAARGPTGPAGAKTFIIDHPLKPDVYLVHGCLEGPEAGVYYRGKGRVGKGGFVEIELPSYTDKLARNWTVHISPIYDANDPADSQVLRSSCVEHGKFKVYGSGSFYWLVHGERVSLQTELPRASSVLRGEGPYRYLA